jgi:ABC-type Co2+ transport system permease subunit
MDIFTAFGLSASAGLNAYIPLLVVALLSKFTNLINLSAPWDTLESWWVIGLLVILSGVEFFADKFPAVNHANDMVQTVIRPVAGAFLFAASAKIITDVHPVLAMIMGLLVAGTVHTVKSLAIRPAVTATTGGAGNVPVSIAEDIVSTMLSIIAAVIPILIGVLMVISGALVVWWIWRRINRERARA